MTLRFGSFGRAFVAAFGLWLVLGASATVGAAVPPDTADLERGGRWGDIADLWKKEVALAPQSTAAWRGYLLALEAGGLYDRLDAEATRAMAAFPTWPEAAIRRARALRAMGKPEDAAEVLRAPADRSVAAAAERAECLASFGKRDEANALYAGLLRLYDPGKRYAPPDLLGFGVAARETGNYKTAAQAMELAYTDSLDYLPARIALAQLFREKYQAELAGAEITDARSVDPYHPDLRLAQADMLLLNKQLPGAEQMANLVLMARPNDAGARRVLAVLDCISERPDLARGRLDAILAVNPYDHAARAARATAAWLEGDSTAWRADTAELRRVDPKSVEADLLLGDLLELELRNDEASAAYRRVLAVDPTSAQAWAALGHIAMREGREAEGRAALERGFDLDHYNIRAYNQLELLDFMETFTEYPHGRARFRLKADEDSVLVPLLAERMDAITADLDAKHGYTPPEPTIVEVFPTHEWFSARVVGLARLEGIPAVCFGDVIAMDSPRNLAGSSNWAQILRHEYGHVLALGMTHRKVPFWFTEGLSVFLEDTPRSLSWDEVLVGAWWDGALVPVDSLTIAFTRPRDRFQRLLAYHQSGLIIGDIAARHGWDAIPKLLRAFGDGVPLEEAVPKVLGESWDTFRRRGMEVALARAGACPVWPVPDGSRGEKLAAAAAAHPDDPLVAARLMISRMQTGQADGAVESARAILERQPEDGLARGILGLAALQGDREEEAKGYLREAVERGVRDVPIRLALGNLYLGERDTTAAIDVFAWTVEVYPACTDALVNLARLELARGDTTSARRWYAELLRVDDSSGTAAKELARVDLARGDGAAARATLDFALDILPLDPDVVALKGQALLDLGEDREAYDLFTAARRLDIRNVESMVGMARYYLKEGDPEEAQYFAQLALKYDPRHPVAKDVLAKAQSAW